jgi:anti-sigma factor RsiW
MNCERVRRYLPLYIDSELSSETTFEVVTHLEACASCRQRMEAELELETALGTALGAVTPAELAAFDRAAAIVGGTATRRRTMAAAAAAVIVLVGAGLGFVWWANRGEDLADVMTHCHRKYLAGATAPMTVENDPTRLTEWFVGQVPFPVSVGRPQGDVKLVGARSCNLGRTVCAYLIAESRETTVSVFQIAASELHAFPKARRALADGSMRTRSGPFSVIAFKDGARVVCAIGEVSAADLDRVAREVTGS